MDTNVTPLYTEIYSGGGKYLTESFPTNFHRRYTRKILAPGEKPEDYREVSAAEMDRVEAADAQWVRPPRSFIDLWNAACRRYLNNFNDVYEQDGRYNEATGFFELNGICDITYEEALIIMDFGHADYANGWYYFGYGYKGRTNLPLRNTYNHGGPTPGNSPIAYNNNMEVLSLVSMTKGDQTRYQPRERSSVAFSCAKLHTVLGPVELAYIKRSDTELFPGCPELKYVDFYFVNNVTFSLRQNPLLDISVFRSLVSGQSNGNSTAIVHADVYSKLTGDTSNAAAAALSPEELAEWASLLDLAAEKNVTFALSIP